MASSTIKNEWSFGICDCFSDCKTCCLSCFCPCITFGRIAEIVDHGSTSCAVSGAIYMFMYLLTGHGCWYSCCYRTKMRKQYNLKGSSCGDILKHGICHPCALTQEYNELRNRGFNLEMGWDGSIEKQNRGVQMAPPTMETGMTK